ncbi:MAG: SDR family NAD(P)-dependent oxidoreductase [Pseudomonadota bacterium]
MQLGLESRVALITGANRGTGAVIARMLAAEGARVIVHGFSEAEARDAADAIGALHVAGDIVDEAAAAQVAHAALAMHGRVDVLVNNYGTISPGKWQDAVDAAWLDIYRRNVLSAVHMIRAIVPSMRAHAPNPSGRIINLGTVGTLRPNSLMPHYYAAKAALANTTVSLARELAGTGITVNTVAPGFIRTAEVEAFYTEKARRKGLPTDWPSVEKMVVEREFPNPCGRIATPEDVAMLVCFLAGDSGAFINGQHLRVDGGALETLF